MSKSKGKKIRSASEVWQRAKDNGFQAKAHEAIDEQRDLGRHGCKTIQDQDRTLERYLM